MAATLRQVGFETTLLTDSDQGEMKRAIAAFGRRLRAAGRDAVGLFFYAGHGIQASGANYLIPISGDIEDEADLDIIGVEADWVLGQMESAGNATNIVVLDACRNNPFKVGSRSGGRGLARMDAPTGSFIAYATAPGDVAADGEGANSPFTTALAGQLTTPGLPIEQIFKRVRIDVLKSTGGQQTPWDSSSLVSDFYFVADAAPEGSSVAEMELWRSVRESGDAVQLALFLQAYPGSAHAPRARSLLAEAVEEGASVKGEEAIPAPAPESAPELSPAAPAPAAPAASQEALIEEAQATGSLEAYQTYLDAYPDGVFADLARAEVAHLQSRMETAALPTDSPDSERGLLEPRGPKPLPQAAPQSQLLQFDAPLLAGPPEIKGLTMAEIIARTPAFPPVEGLPESYWRDQKCESCHQWTQERLCEQGTFYRLGESDLLARSQHPFGGEFKQHVRDWAGAGCN